jgi:hypothetical protein
MRDRLKAAWKALAGKQAPADLELRKMGLQEMQLGCERAANGMVVIRADIGADEQLVMFLPESSATAFLDELASILVRQEPEERGH